MALAPITELILFRQDTGTVKTARGGYLNYGLCKGSSDLVGWYKGMFVAIEVKTLKGKLSQEQRWFLDAVDAAGGFSAVINLDVGFDRNALCVDIREKLDEKREGMKK